MVTSINWHSRESKKWDAPKALAVGCGDDLSGWYGGKTKRTKLEFSGWDLRPYILLHVFVPICTGSTDESSRIFQ